MGKKFPAPHAKGIAGKGRRSPQAILPAGKEGMVSVGGQQHFRHGLGCGGHIAVKQRRVSGYGQGIGVEEAGNKVLFHQPFSPGQGRLLQKHRRQLLPLGNDVAAAVALCCQGLHQPQVGPIS